MILQRERGHRPRPHHGCKLPTLRPAFWVFPVIQGSVFFAGVVLGPGRNGCAPDEDKDRK